MTPAAPPETLEEWLNEHLRKPGMKARVAKIIKEMEAEERAYDAKLMKRRTR